MTSSYDRGGSPAIEIRLLGSAPGSFRHVSAVLDTGFIGFLLLPSSLGIQLGFAAHATMEIVLADGSRHTRPLCLASIDFGGQTVHGPVILEDHGTEALIGMEFLELFSLTMTLDAVALTVTLEPSLS